MRTLGGIESYGGGGSFKGNVSIESEKYDALPEEVRNKIGYDASDYLQRIDENIKMAWAKENEAEERNEHVAKLSKLFESAGFKNLHTEVIDNQYCSGSCCYKFPWIAVTTQKGCIMIGWRKRVINIDWSGSKIKLDGRKIFKDEKVTTDKRYVHAWGYEKAVEYLTKLNK